MMPLNLSLDELSQRLSSALLEATSPYPQQPLWLALSGGLDSALMLTLLARSPLRERLQAVHVHHGLSPEAGAWQAHCEHLCRDAGVPLVVAPVSVRVDGRGIEAAARDARYQAFTRLLPDNALLLLAHHADDQAETLLLRLLRGSGLTGLGAMPRQRLLTRSNDESRRLVRPWLSFTRAELERVATHLGLQWVNDESNDNCEFSRNWLRHDILPQLGRRYPAVTPLLARTAQRLQDDQQLLTELLLPHLEPLLEPVDWPHTAPVALSLPKLQLLDEKMHEHALRLWLSRNQIAYPEGEKLRTWFAQCLTALADRHPQCDLGQVQLQRFRDKLYVWSPAEGGRQAALTDGMQWYGGQISVSPAALERLGEAQVVAAGTLSGVCLRPRAGQPSRSLKDIWQAAGVPVWLRKDWPVIVRADVPVAVVGLLNDDFLNCELIDISAFKWRAAGIGHIATQ